VLDCTIIYILLIIENTTGMPHMTNPNTHWRSEYQNTGSGLQEFPCKT